MQEIYKGSYLKFGIWNGCLGWIGVLLAFFVVVVFVVDGGGVLFFFLHLRRSRLC